MGSDGHPASALPQPTRPRTLAPLPPPVMLSWARAFPGIPERVRSARQLVANLLIDSPRRDDAVIVASELFTNAVVHTASGKPGGLITVQVSRWRDGARIAVTDQGSPTAPVIYAPTGAAAAAESGHGLYLVSCLASHLDWHDDACGRTIWAVLGQLPPGHPEPGGGAPAWIWRP